MIEFKHIQKKYKKIILQDISFKVEKGEGIAIIGANGCGKSTLLSIIAGMSRADKGEIIYNNKNIINSRSAIRSIIGFVPQYNPLIEELSVKDNLGLWLSSNNLSLRDKTCIELLNMLEINQYINKKTTELSGGMKRRVSLAVALANKPKLLLLDEPTTALDLPARRQIRNYIAQYIKNGGTAVIATHDIEEIRLCSRLLIIKNGKAVQAEPDISQAQLEAML